MQEIFDGYGIKVFENGQSEYFIEFDAGEIVQEIVRIPVSKSDADIAMQSSDGAYKVIIKYQNLNQ